MYFMSNLKDSEGAFWLFTIWAYAPSSEYNPVEDVTSLFAMP
jgi:hypothetical protein